MVKCKLVKCCFNLQLPKATVVMTDPVLMAYPPIQRKIKLEILDEHQKVKTTKVQFYKFWVSSTELFNFFNLTKI